MKKFHMFYFASFVISTTALFGNTQTIPEGFQHVDCTLELISQKSLTINLKATMLKSQAASHTFLLKRAQAQTGQVMLL